MACPWAKPIGHKTWMARPVLVLNLTQLLFFVKYAESRAQTAIIKLNWLWLLLLEVNLVSQIPIKWFGYTHVENETKIAKNWAE